MWAQHSQMNLAVEAQLVERLHFYLIMQYGIVNTNYTVSLVFCLKTNKRTCTSLPLCSK